MRQLSAVGWKRYRAVLHGHCNSTCVGAETPPPSRRGDRGGVHQPSIVASSREGKSGQRLDRQPPACPLLPSSEPLPPQILDQAGPQCLSYRTVAGSVTYKAILPAKAINSDFYKMAIGAACWSADCNLIKSRPLRRSSSRPSPLRYCSVVTHPLLHLQSNQGRDAQNLPSYTMSMSAVCSENSLRCCRFTSYVPCPANLDLL
jgi:hypothetical protein